ncbi:MAG: hypothetical protein GY749_22980 [Desulfobacteraceae bacterium]|nr:hypothetical protein [Desulfobacteraceae bacterium]
MALTDEMTQLRDDCLSSLDASHNYYTHTKSAWRIIQQMVRQGQKFTIRNQATGHIVDQTELSGLAQEYITGYLVSATFQHFVSLFEQFVFDLLRAWLTEYPGSLSRNQLQFKTVLDAPDKHEIVTAVVQKEVHGLMYKRVAGWFEYLEKIAELGCPTQGQIRQLAEIKASRDVLVHNNGIANSIYVDKSMGQARFAPDDTLVLPEHYHRESWQLIKQVVSDVTNAVIDKLGN